MHPLVSIIMGSTSDMPVMEKACRVLDELEIPFELNALSAHRTPELVHDFAVNARERGVKVIIAGAGGAAHLPGVIAASTTLPVIGVPIKAGISIDGWDSILSILQMPPGIPVATVGLDAAQNAGLLAVQIIATGQPEVMERMLAYKKNLGKKIVQANEELASVSFRFRVRRGVGG
ncbi:MAG TPA: 5-(carboxyamino)imidazole ribonucleotide mutase [Bacteroidales bacterium]|nr:5-(carboxyamino)imidazole ribonucleotide mutase [Bacteroidales bacterium]HRZ77792.1 5-(carboxyamino)imidazole ribonucleotide mutase [Bacteroidales bacterium]